MIESTLDKVLRAMKKKTAISFLSPRMGGMVKRRLVPGAVQDVTVTPLDAMVLDRIPPALRGVIAVTGLDLGRQEPRTYFVEYMRDVRFLPPARYGGEASPSELFAVVEAKRKRVLARGLTKASADGFSRRWSMNYGEAVIAPEPIHWTTDDQVLEQLRLVR